MTINIVKFSYSLLLFLLITTLTYSQDNIITNTQQNSTVPSILDVQLDPLKSISYKQMYHKPINVSIGQQLSIVLPSFDSLYNSNTFMLKYLSDQEYQITLNKLQKLNSDNQNDDFQNQQKSDSNQQNKQQIVGTPVSENQLPLKCTYIPPQARVYNTISKISDQSGFNRIGFQNKQYIHVTSRQLLYILNNQNMIISVYKYNDMNIKFLSSFQLPINKGVAHDEAQSYSQSHTTVSMSLNSKQSQLYIFSPNGIWIIQTKTFLTNIKQVTSISGLDIQQIGGLDKTIRGGGPYFIAMRKMSKVLIIPQITSNQRAVFTEVTMFNEQRIFPQDIAITSNYLFVLDVFKGVYVYRISADNKARQLFKIALSNYGGYQKIHIFQMNTLFINYNDFDGSKVVEINIDVQNQKAQLVRYYKNDDYFSYIQTYSVLTSSTGFYLSQISSADEVDLKQIKNSAQTLLFMVSNFQQIQIFPFNIDPRTINSMYNGIKIYYPKVKQIHHIFGDRFLIITQDTIDYVKISIQKPQISCLLGSKYNQNFKIQPQNLQITVKSNVSTCQFRDKLMRHKIYYNQNCQLTTQYLIHLNDPQKSNLRKIITYGVVLLVVAAFVLGLYCLVQWRNEKLVILSRLKDQIIRFRNKHRRMQPFVQQQLPHKKQVQMEVPRDIQFIPNQDQYN